MAVSTPWGYEVESLPPLISASEFRQYNPGLYSTDARVMAVLDSVSAAVRDWCGWHVAPSLECTYTGQGEGRLLVLPAMGVTDVASLTIKGDDIERYEWLPSGLVRLKGGRFPCDWRSVTCSYRAGFASVAVGSVVAQVAANMLAASPGVAEEHVGSAGITYNSTGNGITGGVSLLDRDLAILAPYRLHRAW